MTQLKNAKQRLLTLISVICAGLPVCAQESRPVFECGIHQAVGKLVVNNQGMYVLIGNDGSYSPYELILLGGSFSEKFTLRNTRVNAEFYVPQKITSNERPFVFLKKISSEFQEKYKNKKIASKDCGLESEFTQTP